MQALSCANHVHTVHMQMTRTLLNAKPAQMEGIRTKLVLPDVPPVQLENSVTLPAVMCVATALQATKL